VTGVVGVEGRQSHQAVDSVFCLEIAVGIVPGYGDGDALDPALRGGAVVVNERFHSQKFFERVSAERVSIASVVPTLLQFLLHARLSMEAYKLAPFRHFICGGGPLTVELASKVEQTFKMPIIHGYGLSETTCYCSSLPLDISSPERKNWLTKHGFPSIGVPLPANEMEIHDASGNSLEEGERGEIVIRGHTVMKGYLGDPEANAESFAHGWFRSGDEGFFRYDDQGRKFFFITGRIKEINLTAAKLLGIERGRVVGNASVRSWLRSPDPNSTNIVEQPCADRTKCAAK
jgi:long-chain acyl-CoA synthetase